MARKRKSRRRRGEGSVWQIVSGSYRASVPLGKGKKASAVFRTEAEAQAWRRQAVADRERGLAVAAGPGTVGDRVAAWLAARKGVVSDATLQEHRAVMERLVVPDLGAVPLAKFTPAAAAAWADGMARAGRPAYSRWAAAVLLRRAIQGCVGTLIPANPVGPSLVGRPRPAPPRAFTRGEALRLIAAADGGKWGAMVRVVLDAGLRPQEAFALRWADVDLAAGTLRVSRAVTLVADKPVEVPPKTRAGRRTVLLAPATVAALADWHKRYWPNPLDLVWPSRKRAWLHRNNFNRKVWRVLAGRAGVPPLPFKCCRHTSATLLLAAGAPVKAVSQRLGHEGIEITLKFYAAALPTDQAAVAAAAASVFG